MTSIRLIKILLCTLLLVAFRPAVAQDSDIAWIAYRFYLADSLKQVMNTQALTKKEEMELYASIADHYHGVAVDSSIVYRLKALEIAQKLQVYETIRIYYAELGIVYRFKGDYEAALACADRLHELSEMYDDWKAKANAYTTAAYAYTGWGKYNMAIDNYLKRLKLSEEKGNIESVISILENLSSINLALGNTETAFQYAKQAEEKFPLLEEGRIRWWTPYIFNLYSSIYIKKGDYDEALRFAVKANSISTDNNTLANCDTNSLLAQIYLHQGDYDRALIYANESYKYADILKDPSLYAIAGKTMSDIYMAQKRYPEAEKEAFNVLMADTTNADNMRAAAENIALANIYMGRMEKAATYLKKYAEMNQQYTEKSYQTTVSDLAIKYETEKKEARIALLEEERRMYLLLSAAGVLLAVALGFAWLQYIRIMKKKRQLIAAEAIQNGEIGERARIAKDLHDRLGSSLSSIKIGLKEMDTLPGFDEKLDACIKELRDITNNIMPRSLHLYGMKGALEDLCVHINNLHFHFFGENERIRETTEYVVYCCAVELINNAMKHACAKAIHIQLVQSKKHVSLTVQDNGCGFDEKKVVKGRGLQNIRDRVTSGKGKIDITSSPGKGTEAVIELKIEN